jgi:hypothetical protein
MPGSPSRSRRSCECDVLRWYLLNESSLVPAGSERVPVSRHSRCVDSDHHRFASVPLPAPVRGRPCLGEFDRGAVVAHDPRVQNGRRLSPGGSELEHRWRIHAVSVPTMQTAPPVLFARWRQTSPTSHPVAFTLRSPSLVVNRQRTLSVMELRALGRRMRVRRRRAARARTPPAAEGPCCRPGRRPVARARTG